MSIPTNPYGANPDNYGQHVAAAQDDFSITSWGLDNSVQVVECPSGQKVKVKPIDMPDIIELNLLDELDTFSGFFDDSDPEKVQQDGSNLDFMKALSKDGKFSKFMKTLDKVICRGAIQPRISSDIPEDQEAAALKSGVVPARIIPIFDKMAIFSIAFQGLGDMGDFRPGQGEGLGGLEAEPAHEVPTF